MSILNNIILLTVDGHCCCPAARKMVSQSLMACLASEAGLEKELNERNFVFEKNICWASKGTFDPLMYERENANQFGTKKKFFLLSNVVLQQKKV